MGAASTSRPSWQRRLGWVVLGAALASLVFPPFGLWWLAPVAWWPLLHALRGASVQAASRLGFVFGLLLYASVFSWLLALFAQAALALWVILALFTGLFGGLSAWLGQRFQSPWVTAALWAGIEFFRSEWFWLSMDAAGWSVRQHWQHAEQFRHRAAENGRWMVVASSSGITQIIAADGARVSALAPMDPGELYGELGRSRELTPFTRGGWLFGPLCLAGALMLVLARGFSGRGLR